MNPLQTTQVARLFSLNCSPLGICTACWLVLSSLLSLAIAEDWPQFRGPSGTATSRTSQPPRTWSDSENLRWKCELPGAGSSSPIVVGDRVFVTCYSGYGLPDGEAGDLRNLQRHLVCVNRVDGKVLWSQHVAGELPEDAYQGFLTEHGYASNTPVCDGQRVYCFFGKSGVVAFDLQGQQVWKVDVGKESSNRRWGSAASLVVWRDRVIVNASEESQSILALDKSTGKTLWKAEGSALDLAYGTPTVVEMAPDRTDILVAAPGELWGLNAETGRLRWYVEHTLEGNICPSVLVVDQTAYVFGGFRSSGSLAVRLGGQGNVTSTHLLWSTRNSSYVATPVYADGHLYWISDQGQAFCVSAQTGEVVYRERIADLESGGRPVYASPILADGMLYVVTRRSGTLVLPAKPQYEILARNRFESDTSEFNSTPALSDGDLFVRSNRFLYCVATTTK